MLIQKHVIIVWLHVMEIVAQDISHHDHRLLCSYVIYALSNPMDLQFENLYVIWLEFEMYFGVGVSIEKYIDQIDDIKQN